MNLHISPSMLLVSCVVFVSSVMCLAGCSKSAGERGARGEAIEVFDQMMDAPFADSEGTYQEVEVYRGTAEMFGDLSGKLSAIAERHSHLDSDGGDQVERLAKLCREYSSLSSTLAEAISADADSSDAEIAQLKEGERKLIKEIYVVRHGLGGG